MKNKKIPQLLHRLPVLFLALILAVMPLTMAAPAHADVLSGTSSSWILLDGEFSIPLPPSVDGYYPTLFSIDPSTFQFNMYYTSSDFARLVHVAGSLFSLQDVGYFSHFDFDLNSWTVPAPMTGASFSLTDFGDSVIAFNNPGVYIQDGVENVLPTSGVIVPASPGVLDTFSGVGSWLSGAVQNISTMFWTAESGMTVLGYLAVASLALAVILLIFYLIAGWFKFH